MRYAEGYPVLTKKKTHHKNTVRLITLSTTSSKCRSPLAANGPAVTHLPGPPRSSTIRVNGLTAGIAVCCDGRQGSSTSRDRFGSAAA